MNTYQCINDIITEDERKQLLSEAMNFKWWNDKFSFQVLEFYPDSKILLSMFSKDLEESSFKDILDFTSPLIKKLISKVNPKLTLKQAAYVKIPVGGGVRVHKDTDSIPGRRTCITWALSSIKDFSPVIFYNEDKTFNEKVYYKEKPLILNTSKYHSVDNETEPRYSFQLCFYETIEEILELYKKGKVFI